uniref:Uncharacterized protein n=1 Tax=Arundo donax TaxID=35708 RepID=A0A0A9F3D3_ARUDO
MREKCTLNINLGQDVVGDQPELVPCTCSPGIGFGLLRGQRGEPGLRLRAHPPLANRKEGEPAAAGRSGLGGGSRAAAEEEERERGCPGRLGF